MGSSETKKCSSPRCLDDTDNFWRCDTHGHNYFWTCKYCDERRAKEYEKDEIERQERIAKED